ncbi:MAG TPA: TonB family protein [Kofleriaceae bacterium]|nr:TonB family protein [Kofleriaceae bacterium]
MALRIAILLALACSIAHAQAPGSDGSDGSDAGSGSAAAPAQFEPPKPITSTDVPYPDGAPAITAPVAVTVKLRVDPTGAVIKVDLVTPPQPPFDDAVTAAAQQFKFQPGTFGGKPVTVAITFTHTFLPAAPPPTQTGSADTGPAKTSVLRGKLVELGTRDLVTNASIVVELGGQQYTAQGDTTGHFRIELPPGEAVVNVYAPAHTHFVQHETLAAKQEVAVTYLIARDRYDPYEIVVVGDQPRREEVSRISLRGPEIQQVPGTFGDPFRVVQTLPGVASIVSLLPYPVVRGASPSSTAYEIDGTPVPMLFHLLAGPSVIHPDFIDSIQFYPGGAPAPYGGYTAGIIDGLTARADAKPMADIDLSLLEVGGLVREPIPFIDATVTAAARYGFPGLLLSLATNQVSLSYWDYQLRVDGGNKANGWTLFAFGARDELDTVAANADPNASNPPLSPALVLEFHRLDLRYHQTISDFETTYRLIFGYDKTFSSGTDFSVLSAMPSVRSRYHANKTLDFGAGVDGQARKISQDDGADAAANPVAALTSQLTTSYSGSVYAEAIWRPTPSWLIRPGVHGDMYTDNTATKADLDPRLTVRYKLGDRDLPEVAPGTDDSAVWLKSSLGIYHQPPRFILPEPGFDEMPLKYGLSRSIQASLGAEVPFRYNISLSAETYYTYMDPTVFDLSTNDATAGTAANSSLLPTTIVAGSTGEAQFIQRLTTPELGRAYGLEVMLRRQAKSGLYGWISYSLSRSEREMDGEWVPYDYDRTHLLNLVAGLPLPRNWDLGLRMQYESGLPATTTAGYNAGRIDGYMRFDIRVDKRAVYRKWLLDFYVDITNVAVQPEEIEPGFSLRYVLPTVGLRGRI